MSIDDVQKAVKEIVTRHLGGSVDVFLFGSRAQGTHGEGSDIDIGISSSKPIPYELLSAVQDEVEELPTLYTVEVVDFARLTPQFKKVAARNQVPITL